MTKRKAPGDPPNLSPKRVARQARAIVGRITKYRHVFDARLYQHLAAGYSFKSFGAVTTDEDEKPMPVCEATLHNWTRDHPSFLEARKQGEAAMEYHYIRMTRQMALGQIKVPVRTTPVMSNGKPVMDPDNPGKVLYDTVYEAAKCYPAAHIFMLKNLLKWSDRQEVEHTGNPDKPIHTREEKTIDATERVLQLERLRAKRELLGSD